MSAKSELNPTTNDLVNAMAVVLMAFAAETSSEAFDRIYLDILRMTERMDEEGHHDAATVATALAGALQLPNRESQPYRQ